MLCHQSAEAKLECNDDLKYKKIKHPKDPNRMREICIDSKGLAQGPYVNLYDTGEVQF